MRRIAPLLLLLLLLLDLCGQSAAGGDSNSRNQRGGRQASYLRAADASQHRHPLEDRLLQSFSEAPTASTAQGTCSLNSNGFYGNAIGSVYELQFSYQTLLTSDATIENLVNDVAPALDIGIPEAILPSFFSECGARRRGLQMVEPTIEGVSRLQTDYVITNGNFCVGGSADRNCYVFSGSINVFGQNFYTQSDVENVVLPVIQQVIQDGQLLPLSPYLEKVTYLDDGMQTAPPVPTYAPQPTVPTPSSPTPTASPAPGSSFPTPNGGSFAPTMTAPPSLLTSAPSAAPTRPINPHGASRVPWWGWLLVALGAVGLILCVYLALAEDDRGRPKPSSSDAPDKDGEDTGSYEPPGDEAYVPPPDAYGAETMDTSAFRLGPPSGNLGVVQENGENADDFPNDEVDEETYEEETYEEGEGDEEEGEDDGEYEDGEEDEEGEEGDEYEDGEEYEEGDEEYEEGEGDEEGDEEYEDEYDEEGEGEEDEDEEEYYEEETMETPGTEEDGQRWR